MYRFSITATFLILTAWCGHAAEKVGVWEFERVDGKRIAPFLEEGTKAMVVVFIATDCPVANYFQPTLRRLQKKYAGRGVEFVFLHADPSVTREAAQKHAEDYSTSAHVVLDPEFAVARRLAATVTPEAFLIDRAGKVIYRGRVNDMYVDWGKKRRAPRREDLDIAIGEFLRGKKSLRPRRNL